VLLAAVAVACSPAAEASPPPDGTAAATHAAVVSDVVTYKGDAARTGQMPGPGPARAPVLLWRLDVDAAIAAAPLVANGHVIVGGADGVVRAIRAETGVESWTARLPARVSSTPTIANRTLYVTSDDGVLRTVSLDDHRLGWTRSGLLPGSIVTATGDTILVGAPDEIVAVSAARGEELWRAPAAASGRTAAAGGTAYASGDGSGVLTAVDANNGTARWTFETRGSDVLTPAVRDGHTYVVARDVPGGRNVVFALDGSANERWTWETPRRDRIDGHAVSSDRVFVVTDRTAVVYALDRSEGTLVWSRPLQGESITFPIVVGDVVYTASDRDGIIGIDARTGEVRSRTALSGGIDPTRITVTGGLLFVTTSDRGGRGSILAFAGAGDPRLAAVASPPHASPSRTPDKSPQPVGMPVRIRSVDPVEGSSLLLSTSVAPDGTMYVADMANSRIVVRHANGTIEMWGERGSGAGQFDFSEVTQNSTSTSVSVSPDGELIAVGDGANHRVQLFDKNRRWLRSIGRIGRGDGQFINPCCVTVDGQHRIWVVDTARADVQVFGEIGRHLRTLGRPGTGDGELMRPASAFVSDATNEVFVPDFGNRRVSVFSTGGVWLRSYGGRPADGFVLDEVNAVAVDRFGRLFVLDTTNRIFILGADGRLQAVIPAELPGVGRVEFAGFALGDRGELYFADIGGGVAGRLIVAQLEPPLWPEGAGRP
jgi:outer membrane protein assembly factor BamB